MTMQEFWGLMRTRWGALTFAFLCGTPIWLFGLALWSGSASPATETAAAELAPPVPETQAADAAPPEPETPAPVPVAKRERRGPDADARIRQEMKWGAVAARLARANSEAESAQAVHLNKVREFFAEREEGAKPFAEAVLGFSGKLTAVGTIADEALAALANLFGAQPAAGPDRLVTHICRCYREHVLDQARIKQALDQIAGSYIASLKEVEARLLVDLRADLSDEATGEWDEPPSFVAESIESGQFGVAIRSAYDMAAADLLVGTGTLLGGEVVEAVVGNSLTKDMNSTVGSIGVKAGVGIMASRVISDALAAAGYDPVARIAVGVKASLIYISDRVVEGEPEAAQCYVWAQSVAFAHPDEPVRAACMEAAEALERHRNLGLRLRLKALTIKRGQQFTESLYKHVFGPDAALPRPAPGGVDFPSNEEILKAAKQITQAAKGGQS